MSLSSARLLLTFLGLLAACASRPALPAPELPLARTPESEALANPPQLTAAEAEPLQAAIESATLPNGLTLLVATRRNLPYVMLSVATRGAGTFESSCSPEVLRLTARAVVEGGTTWADGSTVEQVSVHGRSVGFDVAAGHTHFDLPVLREALPAGLEVLARTVQKPAFAGGLDPVRVHEIDSLKRRTDGIDSQLLKLAAAGSYGDAFAEKLVPSRLDVVREASDALIRSCYTRSITPESSALIAVGDVTLAEVRELAEPLYGSWPSTGHALQSVTAQPALQSSGLQLHWVVAGERPQASVVLLQPAPTQLNASDEVPFALLSELAVGPSRSRSNNRLRHDQGVTYGLQPELIHGRNVGLLLVRADFETDAMADAIRSLLETLKELQEKPVTAAELANAKRRFMYRVTIRASSNDRLASYIGELFAQGKAPSWLEHLQASLDAIQPQDLLRVAKHYLRPSDTDLGVYCDADMENELAFLGRVATYQAHVQ